MKLQFDANQPYQLTAIQSVIDLFDGQPLADPQYSTVLNPIQGSLFGTVVHRELGAGNNLLVDEAQLLKNLQSVQDRNLLEPGNSIKSWTWEDDDGVHWCPHFSVEMETGTGKTYVYLRTILALNQKYGFSKFVIVVPSVAIREGVLKNLEITKEHFRALFNNVTMENYVYESRRVAQLRQFALSNSLQILVINIDAFRKNFVGTEEEKKSNLIYIERDAFFGRRPIQYLQATHPIVIIDEPQSVDNTERAQQAIRALDPLCTLRYSATHRNPYNLVYKLDPVKAYELRLVKQIIVSSVTSGDAHNDAYVKLCSVDNKNGIRASVEIDVAQAAGLKRKRVTVKNGDDLYIKSGERSLYETGHQISEICAESGNEFILLTNGIRLGLEQQIGSLKEDLWKAQIHRTVLRHFQKELELRDRSIKVLSLFFIDRVANYRTYDDKGKSFPGKFVAVLEQACRDVLCQSEFKPLGPLLVEQLHGGYFAQDKKGVLKDTRGDTQADDDTYSLIMRDKERLLSFEEPLRFIFSHSALREGWDNPNIFQICTLNETSSSLKKRQEIGRGLRLPVDQKGIRVFDDAINRLVVIANESYESFARSLQNEYEDECGVTFGKVTPFTFVGLERLVDGTSIILNQTDSRELLKVLQTQELVDDRGRILPKFKPTAPDFSMSLPEPYTALEQQVLDTLSSLQLDQHIKRDELPIRLNYKKAIALDPEFQELWNRIKYRTRYSVQYSTDELVQRALRATRVIERIEPVKLHFTEARLDVEHRGVTSTIVRESAEAVNYSGTIPDVISYLQQETELTRATLVKILTECGRLSDIFVNPQRFMDAVASAINHELNHLILDGIKYEKIAGTEWEMRLFETQELLSYLHNRLEVKHSIYDAITYDSQTERNFAQQLDQREDIRLFVKLPKWFKVETPVGEYNPDWAIVKHDSTILYLVRETKATKDFESLRNIEANKVRCGRRHFESLGVDFAVVTGAHEI